MTAGPGPGFVSRGWPGQANRPRLVIPQRQQVGTMRRMAAIVVIGIVSLAGARAMRGAVGQSPAQAVQRFKTGIELVLLDVSVLDRDRRPVRGLTAADFTVVEDERRQTITNFSAIDIADTVETEARAPWIRDVVPDVRTNTASKDRRLLAIVMDDATPMPAADVLRAKELAERLIDGLGPGDLACVAFAVDKKSGQEFTEDRARLGAAVDRFTGAVTGGFAPFDAFDKTAMGLYAAAIGTVQALAESLAEVPERRKAVAWISVGVPLDWALAAPAAISLEEPGTATISGVAQDVIRSVRELVASAGRANVNIYGMDPGGLRAPSVFAPLGGTPQMTLNTGKLNVDFLENVSATTGGFAVVNTNDPNPGIQQMFRENGSYYLLGYTPSNLRREGRLRKVEVRVSRPDVTVRARSGYFEPLSDKRAKANPPPSAAVTALGGILPNSDLAMAMNVAPFAVPGRRDAALAIVVGMHRPAPPRAVRVVDTVDLQVAAYSAGGQRRAGRREKIPVTLESSGVGGTMGFELLLRLDLPPGRYQLRLAAERSAEGSDAARDEANAGRSGSVYADIEVPAFAKDALSLSGLVIGVTPPVVSGPTGALASLVPIVPTTLRDFTKDDQVTAFLRIYQGGARPLVPVDVAVRIVDGQGATVFETSEKVAADRFGTARAADHRFDLPIARLVSGEHLLTVEAMSGKASARRDVRFRVR
jgi:VWFA-related protein